MDEIDLAHMRRSYESAPLLEGHVLEDPVAQLRRWLDEAHASDVAEANAMCISTVHGGRPSSRMVLLRGLDHRGLLFYTSYFSRKGRELAENPHAAALFYWPQLERQVRVEGDADQLPEEESDAYFASRPRGHQLGAWASEQSESVESREILDQRMQDYAQRFEGEEVPRPHSWGGFVIKPVRFEFWQGRANRMHDRLEFTRGTAGWSIRRLQP
jgi:pyridoxamine 5'-phosphate oxidase